MASLNRVVRLRTLARLAVLLPLLFGLRGALRPAVAAPRSKPPIRVIVITGGHDFERGPFFAMFDALPGIEWKEAVQPAANTLYTAREAAKYDVVVLYDFVQEIAEDQKRQLVRLLKEDGKGLVGLHHALGDYQQWPEFRRILGGRFFLSRLVEEGGEYAQGTYDHDQHFAVEVVDTGHPIARGLKNFEIDDETYNGFYVSPGTKPLLRVRHPKSGPVIAWSHHYGKARVVYLQLGHGPSAYAHPSYRQLVANALHWVSRRAPE